MKFNFMDALYTLPSRTRDAIIRAGTKANWKIGSTVCRLSSDCASAMIRVAVEFSPYDVDVSMLLRDAKIYDVEYAREPTEETIDLGIKGIVGLIGYHAFDTLIQYHNLTDEDWYFIFYQASRADTRENMEFILRRKHIDVCSRYNMIFAHAYADNNMSTMKFLVKKALRENYRIVLDEFTFYNIYCYNPESVKLFYYQEFEYPVVKNIDLVSAYKMICPNSGVDAIKLFDELGVNIKAHVWLMNKTTDRKLVDYLWSLVINRKGCSREAVTLPPLSIVSDRYMSRAPRPQWTEEDIKKVDDSIRETNLMLKTLIEHHMLD